MFILVFPCLHGFDGGNRECIIFIPAFLTIMNCLYCEKPITSGNKGKKYCNDGCKTAYHNQQKSEENDEIQKIKLALINNRRILQRALGKESEVLVSKENLLKKGFEFDFHTHHVISRIKGNEFIFCYNYGYRVMDDGKYKVVKSFR